MAVFGSALEKKMRAKEWEPKDLAARSQIPIANIYRWLSGRRPSPDNVGKLAKAFGEEPAEWMILADYPVGEVSDPDELEKELLTQIRTFPWLRDLVPDVLSLSPQNQAVIRDIVRSLQRQEGNELE